MAKAKKESKKEVKITSYKITKDNGKVIYRDAERMGDIKLKRMKVLAFFLVLFALANAIKLKKSQDDCTPFSTDFPDCLCDLEDGCFDHCPNYPFCLPDEELPDEDLPCIEFMP